MSLRSAVLGSAALLTLACAKGFLTENGKLAVGLSVAELAVIFDSLQSRLKYLTITSRPVQGPSVESGEISFQGKVSSLQKL